MGKIHRLPKRLRAFVELRRELLSPAVCVIAAMLALVPSAAHGADRDSGRSQLSLNGEWEFRVDSEGKGTVEKWYVPGASAGWNTITVPSAWELTAGTDFDGVGWYRKDFKAPDAWKGSRVFLEFDAVATTARAWVNGIEVGEHTGDYVPFRFEITHVVKPGAVNVVVVRVDESVGHVTQGFLSAISLHHGGIWQGVRAYSTGAVAFRVDGVWARTDVPSRSVTAQVAFDAEPRAGRLLLEASVSAHGDDRPLAMGYRWIRAGNGEASLTLTLPRIQLWDIDSPNLYDLRVSIRAGRGGVSDEKTVRFGFRTVGADGEYLKLNGRPITFRGILDWGYYYDKIAPAPDSERIRRQFADMKRLGYNGVNLVMVIMNPEYYDIADEMGFLIWQEYPLWHMPIDETTRDELLRMYRAFYVHDRSRPSVILRSITCESGGIDQSVMKELYDLGKELNPGIILEDNSSWFWLSNPELSDIWDEHPYITNSQWVNYIERLDTTMADFEKKPFLLGETMAFNTWIDSRALLRIVGDERPWWLPKVFEAALATEKKLKARYGEGIVERLLEQSTRYSLLSRKFQIELFRTRPGNTGYVINVIRDIPLIRCGMYDDSGNLRWNSEDWSFQSPVTLILKTPDWRSGFYSGEGFSAQVLVSNFGKEDIQNGLLRWSAEVTAGNGEVSPVAGVIHRVSAALGEVRDTGTIAFSVSEASSPVRVRLNVQLGDAKNYWDLWFLPRPQWSDVRGVSLMKGGYRDLKGMLPYLPEWDPDAWEQWEPIPAKVIVSSVLTHRLVEFMKDGGRVILLASRWPGGLGAVPHMYWRDSIFVPPVAPWSETDAQALTDLQGYDLTRTFSRVIPVGQMGIADEVDPLLRLFDTHDLAEVVPFDQLFATRVGDGMLIGTSLDFADPAGQWVLGKLVEYALSAEEVPPVSISDEKLGELAVARANVILPLAGKWRFKLDPQDVGVAEKWFAPSQDDSSWDEIPVGSAWEAYGYAYDGWAWYRRSVDIPANWEGAKVRLVAEGVDDVYGLYVNGDFVAFHGDLAKGHDEGSIWLQQTVSDVSEFIRAGETNVIALRVLDWTGNGGIWRPIYLTSE